MARIALLFLSLTVVLAISSTLGEEAVKGKWLTERDKALTEAQRLKKPILAVAMDHA